MHKPRFALLVSLILLVASGACNAQKRGGENLTRGQALLATSPSAAIEEYRLASKAGADRVEVNKGLAAAYERSKEFEKATALLRDVLASRPNDLDARLALARIDVLQLRFDAARVKLEPMLKHEPPQVSGLLLYAALAQSPAQGQAGLDAMKRLDKARFAPLLSSAEGAFARANLMAASGDAAGATTALTEAASSKAMNPQLALALANASRAVNRTRFAEWLLSRASGTAGASREVHETLAEVSLSQHHMDVAQSALSKLRIEFEPDLKVLLLLAQYHDERGAHAERAKVARQALELVPAKDDAERRKVTVMYATALAKSGNAVEAAKVLSALLERDPAFPSAVLLLADTRLGQKQPDQAIELAQKLEGNEQLRTEAYQILVAAELLKKSTAGAEAAARRFLATSSGCPDAVMLLVNLLVHNKHPELALHEVEIGLVKYPNQGELLATRITLTEQVKGFAKAQEVALEATAAKNPKALRERAHLYERHKLMDQAIHTYRELATAEPKALVELSQLQDKMGHLEDALDSMREYAKAEPSNVEALQRLGMLEERAGHADAAKAAYTKILGFEPDDIVALNNLAMLLSGVPGESRRAVEIARKAYELGRSDIRIADTLGWALVLNNDAKDRSEAVRLLEQSSAGLGTPEANYHYGAALAADGAYAKAKVALNRALSPKGEFSWRPRAVDLLNDVTRRLESSTK